ncbi:VOC family protein [Streptomyces yaizuensis]|uniref:VOC family protein n=1 Tax=Streptomyces yaizuensis TaxID=2989713 RepID=A0ABQ5PA06_9ACTN|nr:VOC family protein [Streptomyces sp. YSPA8]GLF99386.1 VOC family protein [Streptomyces sp. YSPA8]
MTITGFDHVLLAAPPGSEERLRTFYAGVLGMTEIPKPPALAGRGGCWFASGTVQLHLGIEREHRPSAKAHPALRVTGIDAVAAAVRAAGTDIVWDTALPGQRRFHCVDPVGNRLEFLEPTG